MAINVPIITTFADKGVNQAQKAFGDLSKSTMIAGAAIGAAVVAVGAFAYSAIQKASDFNEAISKNTVVFGAISKEVENFAQTANRALGLSETAALKAAGQFAIFGKSAGLAGKDLSDFSIELVTLAADLASFSNTSVDEAINALGSALRGEAEPLRKYGVLLDDATLKAAATELGIYSGNKALTAQQKVLAAQKVIFDQTADAQGDFSRTSTGLAAQQKILGATLDNIKTNLGQAFLPIFLKAVQFFNDEVSPAFERVAEVIGEKGLVKGMQQALYEMGSFGPGMVSAFKSIAVTGAKVVNVLYALAQITAATFLFGIGKFSAGFDALKKSFNEFIDVDALGASFDNFAAGIMNMGSASDYSSFAAKQLAENATAAAEAAKKIIPPAGAAEKATYEYADALKKGLIVALDDAKKALDDAQKTLANFAENVAKSLLDAFSFADAKTAGDETGKGFLSGLRDQVNGIKDYSNDIQKALNLGLSQASLAAVLAAGGEAGAAIAKELVKGGETAILETNALVDSANMAAQKVGINAANAWYKTGVDNAQKTVDGLQTEIDKLTPKMMKQMDNLANKLARTVDITVRVNQIVTSVTGNVSTPVPTPVTGSGTGGNVFRQSAGDNYNINVTGVMSTAETGEAVVNALRAYNRAAGPANIQVA